MNSESWVRGVRAAIVGTGLAVAGFGAVAAVHCAAQKDAQAAESGAQKGKQADGKDSSPARGAERGADSLPCDEHARLAPELPKVESRPQGEVTAPTTESDKASWLHRR